MGLERPVFMRKYDDIRLNMHMAVQLVLQSFEETWSGQPGFAAAVAEFNSTLAQTEALMMKVSLSSKGETLEKADARKKLTVQMLLVAGAIRAFAHVNKDQGVAGQVKLSKTGLGRLRDTTFLDRGKALLQLSQRLAGSLVPYGVNGPVIAALEQAIARYELVIAGPRVAVVKRLAARKEAEALFRNMHYLQKEVIDRLMLRWKGTDFGVRYGVARKLVKV